MPEPHKNPPTRTFDLGNFDNSELKNIVLAQSQMNSEVTP